MRIPISKIQVNPGRRDTKPRNVEELARILKTVGLINPITVTQDNTLQGRRNGQADSFTRMFFEQSSELWDSAYAVTEAIREFSKKVNALKDQKQGEINHEN